MSASELEALAFTAGVLRDRVRDLETRLQIAEERLAASRELVDTLHDFHGETVDVLRERGLGVYLELDGTYTVYSSRQDEPVFAGTELVLLRWVLSGGASEVAA